MVCGLEGFPAAALPRVFPSELLIDLEVALELERGASVPTLMFAQRFEEFAPKQSGLLYRQRLQRFFFVFIQPPTLQAFQGVRGGSEKRLALQKSEQVAIERRVDLQSVTTMFDDIGIHEAWNDAFAQERFGNLTGEGRGDFGIA